MWTPRTASFHTTTARWLPWIVACLVVAAVWITARRETNGGDDPIDELLAKAADDPRRVGPILLARARENWDEVRPHIPGMLSDDDPVVRVLGVRAIGEHREALWLAALVPRAGDVDWRVRRAAFEAMARFAPIDDMPARDTPVDLREETLLAWLGRGALPAREPVESALCELYAQPAHVVFGGELIARCAVCHEGPATSADVSAAQCAQCHADIHAQWSASAHANSLTHLHPATIDPATRELALFDFGDRRGMDCTACHLIESPRDEPMDDMCAFLFTPRRSDTAGCADCHVAETEQWRRWGTGDRPHRIDWPPGQIVMEQSDTARSCTDCHMPAQTGDDAAAFASHTWAARRDPAVLRSGIDVDWLPARGDDPAHQPVLVLTNLAGHDMPTGSRRRAVDLTIAVDGGPPGRLLRLTPLRAGHSDDDSSPALSPGEQRIISLDLPADARSVAYQLIYVRNRFGPDGYSVAFDHGNLPITP